MLNLDPPLTLPWSQVLLPPFLSGPSVDGTGVTIATVVAGVPKLSTLLSLIQTYPTIRTLCTNASTSGTLFAPDNEVSPGAFLLHPRSHSREPRSHVCQKPSWAPHAPWCNNITS